MTTAPEALRIGVLGAANIARLFIAGVHPSQKVVVKTVAARDIGYGMSTLRSASRSPTPGTSAWIPRSREAP